MESLATTAEALSVHQEINRTAVPFPDEAGVNELFEDCAARHVDAVAVVHRDRKLTYGELNELANGLADVLRTRGVLPGDTVGVCVERSPELIVGLLAVLKCGAAYLPFDASWPDERLWTLFGDARCRRVLTDRNEALSARFPECEVVPAVYAEPPRGRTNPVVPVRSHDVAYINFTSGSTGKPKGVPIQHHAIARLVFGAVYARLDAHARLLQLAPVSFDAATFEIWGALLHGGTCVLYPGKNLRLSELKRVLDEHRVTVLFLTTALFNTVVIEAPETLGGLDTLLTGGEEHSLKHMAKALQHYGRDRLVSVYGPTECTTFATFHPVRELRPEDPALPIGRPIQNTRLYVVDGEKLCAPGETGEVLLAGAGLSPGYLGMPGITRQRFIDRDVAGRPERLYRTGDRAYLRADGDLVFQGRQDDQVKISGFRIELGEVAHHIRSHPTVKQSYVTATELATGEKALVAFVVPHGEDLTPEGLRTHLRTRLPGYMVPSAIHLRASLPLTATGKVDRRVLLSSRPGTTGVTPL
ncbi:amino acid adenylation domain-containing protein [Streptomyces decoyicus]|uniref:amino acid adenylation domain-containing protein n=1 Tax=Streptomyces decoyicus TaxID=249567 RepID=UPI002E173FAE|nr:amino acid adenylation domain-containing protein [Streptomyces decoyicus]